MTAVLVTRDLMLASQVQAEANTEQIELVTVSDLDQVAERAAAAAVVAVDLAAVTGGLSRFVEELRSTSADCRVVAFAPHVHRDRLAAARDAACHEVLSRGQFHANAARILRGDPPPQT